MSAAPADETPEPFSFETSSSVVLRGDTWGPADGRPVVLLHGGGQTRHSWSGTARSLAAAGYRATSIDQRGHGDSDWSPDSVYGIDRFSTDAGELARSFEHPPALVGASLGGVASLMAQDASGQALASALVLVDVGTKFEQAGVQRIYDFMMADAAEGFATLDDAADAVASYNKHRTRPRDVSGLAKNLRQRENGRWYWHWDPAFLGGDSGPSITERSESGLLDDAARALTVPTLLVRGRQSDVLSQEGADHFLAVCPQAAFADITDAGHMVAGDQNDAFSRAVIDFLREHVPPHG